MRLVSPSQASKPFALPVVLFLAVLPQLPLVPLGHPLAVEWWSVFFEAPKLFGEMDGVLLSLFQLRLQIHHGCLIRIVLPQLPVLDF